jgi:hypothetical protein
VHFAAGHLTAGELDERLAAALRAKSVGDLRRLLADLPDLENTLQQTRFRSEQTGSLARGYRRLLACYPAWYRRVHEDEMLAVLMTDAPPEKRRPAIAEAADLLLGALRIRCQPSRTGGAEPAWRDALAVLSVIVPLNVLLNFVAGHIHQLMIFPSPPLQILESLAFPLVLAALVPLALRVPRLAALGAAGLLIWLVSGRLLVVFLVMSGAYPFLALGTEIFALTASPGPRRGLQILTWRHWAFAVIASLLADSGWWIPITPPLTLAVIAVICAAMALASSLGRWLLLLLAIPAYPSFAAVFLMGATIPPPSAARIAALYLPPLAMLALAIAAARRTSFRPS